jgi:hypothetical protein
MIVEERVYTLHPGKLPAFLKVYEEQGLAVQRRILGGLIGHYVSEIGTLNQVVHLWAYESLDDRERRRALLMLDAGFKAYLAAALSLIQTMENRILKPSPFYAEEAERLFAGLRK